MPASDPITGVANAISAALGIAAPLIAEHEAQAHENERSEMFNAYAAAAAAGNAYAMHRAIDRMLNAAGQPVASRSGDVVRIGCEYLDALARVAADAVKAKKDLNSLAAALKKS
ncbi:MAG: hypothetical protein NTY01_05525 [Verrucomicrobia bacterium]|nr:hypothetical protein [Verrucomicrobiota bacterium]